MKDMFIVIIVDIETYVILPSQWIKQCISILHVDRQCNCRTAFKCYNLYIMLFYPFYHGEHTVASTHFTALQLQNIIQVVFCYSLGFSHSIIVNRLLLVLILLLCSCRTSFKWYFAILFSFNYSVIVNRLLLVLISLHCSCRTSFKWYFAILFVLTILSQ